MAFCPVCEDEFRPGFTRCLTCHAELVDELLRDTPQQPAVQGDFVCEIHRGVAGSRLHLLCSLFEANSIPVHVQTIGVGPWTELGGLSALTGTPSELNAARILVRQEDLDRAEDLLRAAEAGSLSMPVEGGYGDMGGPPLADR